MRIAVGLLALWLGALTARHVGVWSSEAALWSEAARIAPSAPRPLVNLAMVGLREQRYAEAEALLLRASALADQQPTFERAWSHDLIAANLAQVWLGQGHLAAARALLVDAPAYSRRWTFCQQVPTVCRSSPSSD